MDAKGLVDQAKRIIESCEEHSIPGVLAEATEFLRVYAGEKSAFYIHLSEIRRGASPGAIRIYVKSELEGFVRYVENDLLGSISMQRKLQIDIVSDFLEQAEILLSSKQVHPAAPAVVIGAALEEFLRNWVGETGLDLQEAKPSLDAYAKALREADLITKQDMKDITSWTGLRNHAAHGVWAEVDDKQRVQLMLEGVNLFFMKYGERPVSM